jgi:hypothetical protein
MTKVILSLHRSHVIDDTDILLQRVLDIRRDWQWILRAE